MTDRSDLTSFLTRHRGLALLLLFLFSVAVRLLTAEYVDIGGDNATRWMEVHRLIEGLGYTGWTHQTARWSIALQLWALMKAFGTHPALYYVLPILYASLGAVFTYLYAERLQGAGLGLSAALLVIFFPQMAQSGSQLWPSVFQYTFLAAAVWLVMVWVEERRSPLPLILAGAAYFLAWGARETAMVFFPGMLLLIWLPSRSLKGVLIFCLASGALFCCEALYFWLDTGNILGRSAIVKHSMDVRGGVDTLTWKTYLLSFTRYKNLRGLLILLVLSLAACVAELRAADPRRRALALFYLLYMVLMTYLFWGIDEPKLVHPVGSRYWCAGAPFGLVSLLLWLSAVRARRPRVARWSVAALFAACVVFTLLKIPPTNSVLQVAHDQAVLAPVLADGRPLIEVYQEWQPNRVEQLAMKLVHYKGATKVRRPEQVPVFMIRNAFRMAAMFLPDVRRFAAYSVLEGLPLDAARYTELTAGQTLPPGSVAHLFVPPGASPDALPAAEVLFDRRHCQALPLGADARP